MNADIDLKKIEKKSWTVYFQDGLWDIYMGMLMLVIGINIFIDNEWFTWLMIAPILLIILGKRFITTPRLGRVRFGSERQKKRIAVFIVIALAVICGIVLVTFSANGDPLPKAAAAAVFGMSAILVFADVLDDFVIVRYLSSDASTETTSMRIYQTARAAPTPALNAMATIILVVSALVIVLGWLAYRRWTRKQGESTDVS